MPAGRGAIRSSAGKLFKPTILLKMSAMEKKALFVDGANLYACARAIELDLDYKRLLNEFSADCGFVKAFYYLPLIEGEEDRLRPMTDWLGYNGFDVVTKIGKGINERDRRHNAKEKIYVELAVDMMEIARQVDQIIVFTGNGIIRRVVEAVQRKGARVAIVSTISTQPQLVADELRRQADEFIDLAQMRDRIERQHKKGDGMEKQEKANSRS